MYILITTHNCLNCQRSKQILDDYNVPYVEIDRSYASSSILEMCELYQSSLPYIFKLNYNGYDDLEKQLLHSYFP